MAEVAPAPAPAPAPAAAKAKAAKKKVVKPKKVGPSVSELIVKAVSASGGRIDPNIDTNEKSQKQKQPLAGGGYDVEKNNARVKNTIIKLVVKGTLVQTKGTGATGSFKMSKKVETKVQKTAPKAKKPAAKKPAVAKKPKSAAAKKPAAAKKSLKKATKPAAAKEPTKSPKKVAKSPKKVAKSPKKVVKKAPAPKKAPARKVAKPKVKRTAAKKK
ncbi:histone H1-like [Hippoglossus stenolepis]|uniref:histone H1-like n=1 Tax=Hippoglossus stenolepis TaxID=195615 RepID=UPI001FAFF9E1|nr:histone H1-like [Hippoglossus stenolepis]